MFEINKASPENLCDIVEIMNAAIPLLKNPDWFMIDTPEYLSRHFSDEGFTLKAMSGNRMAAFLTVRIPADASDNMAFDYDFSRAEAHLCAHMETCVVHPDFRGNHLEARLFAEAELLLSEMGFFHLFGTVHPDNLPSVKSFYRAGFSLLEQKEKYSGYLRNIMYKEIEAEH